MKRDNPVINIAWKELAAKDLPLQISAVSEACFKDLASVWLGDMHVLSLNSPHLCVIIKFTPEALAEICFSFC